MGAVHAWIASYLDYRTCYVIVNRQCSRAVSLVCGLPWGSVLDPKFWYSLDLDNLNAHQDFIHHGYKDMQMTLKISDEGVPASQINFLHA
jgi:hypothetical protein